MGHKRCQLLPPFTFGQKSPIFMKYLFLKNQKPNFIKYNIKLNTLTSIHKGLTAELHVCLIISTRTGVRLKDSCKASRIYLSTAGKQLTIFHTLKECAVLTYDVYIQFSLL